MTDLTILFAIMVRIYAAVGAYFDIIKKLLKERLRLPVAFRDYNNKLILSVSTFITTCLGTALFQVCRTDILFQCSTPLILDIISLFNSLSLLAAYYVMKLIINSKPTV